MNLGRARASDLRRKTKIKGILISERKLNQEIFSADKKELRKKQRLQSSLTPEFKLNCKFRVLRI